MTPLTKNRKKQLLYLLEKKYGMAGFDDATFFEAAKNRIHLWTGSWAEGDIDTIGKITKIADLGLYFGIYNQKGNDFCLTLDAAILFRGSIKKQILDLSEDEYSAYRQGETIYFSDARATEIASKIEPGFLVVRHGGDILGVAKYTAERQLLNYLPKERTWN